MRGVKPNQPCEAELVEDFPEVPDHPPITRRDQFAVKNSLKKDKQDKQEARAKAKATAKPKPRGRPKKQHVDVEDPTIESADLRKQKKAEKNKAARKRRQTNKRKNKAKRVRAAQKLQKDDGDKASKTCKHSKPGTGKAPGKKSQPDKNQPSAGSTAKSKGKNKETGRTRKTQITAEPDEKLKKDMIGILQECQQKGCSCDDHRQEVWDLRHCTVPGYSFSTYWTRPAVGLKTLVTNLPKELQNPKAKKPDQQFAYFADGPCPFVNLFMMTYLVIP